VFGIEIPRDPNHADGCVSTARLWLTRPERQVIDKFTSTLSTLPQATVAVLHEGFRQWSFVCEELEVGLLAAPALATDRPEPAPALHPRGVSRAYGAFAAHVPDIEPLLVTYATPVAPEPFGASRVAVETRLRQEVGFACAVAMAAMAYEMRERPVGLVTTERGFVAIPWPFVPRFFEQDANARFESWFDAAALDNPDGFRSGLEF
jgi:hypothetical protein